MPAIAPIDKTNPVVIPARVERTYNALDVKEIKITRRGDQYTLQATFLPRDPINDENLTTHKLTWLVSDLVTYLSDKPGALNKVKDFVKAIAAQAQADPEADKPQTVDPGPDLEP